MPSVPLPRRPNADLLRLPGRLVAARRAALEVVDRIAPDVICGFGGFVSVPAYLAARTRRVPLVVHGNTLPGVANKLGAYRFTDHVATSFPDTDLPHASYVGLPIRRMIATLDRAAHREEALATWGLRPDLPVLLVTGGSQGAASLNRAVLGAARAFADAGVQVLHLTGPAQETEPPETGVPYVTVGFVDRMDLAYSAADPVLCRSGAKTVAELSGVGLPAVYVPLPNGNGEQGPRRPMPSSTPVVAILVDDEDLTPTWVGDHVYRLLAHPTRLGEMGDAAAEVGRRGGDDQLLELVLAAAGRKPVGREPFGREASS